MATKPLTTAAIAMTEKKMDMSLDDIIKMSKTGTGTNKSKTQRIPNKNHKFTNNDVQNKSMKLRRFMDTRSSLRQGALAQKRSSFQGNQFPFAAEAARKAASAPIHNKNFTRNPPMTSYRPRANRAAGFPLKREQVKVVVSKQRPQTLDSLFANMKEQRIKALSQTNTNTNTNTNGTTRSHQRPRPRPRLPPWTRTRTRYNNH